MRHILLLLVLCPLLALAGCGSQDTRKVSEGHWSFAIPEQWQETPPSGDRWQQAYQGDGVRIEVAGHLSDESIARGALGQLSFPAMQQLESFQSQSIENIEVEGGAKEVVIQRYTFSDGGQPRAGAWIVGTQWPNPESAAISVSSEGHDLDEQVLIDLIESAEWKATT